MSLNFYFENKLPRCKDISMEYNAKFVRDYCCPNCGESHNDNDEKYIVNNDEYPKLFNESKGSTMDGNYWNWDELHCCEECNIKFWFKNGAY